MGTYGDLRHRLWGPAPPGEEQYSEMFCSHGGRLQGALALAQDRIISQQACKLTVTRKELDKKNQLEMYLGKVEREFKNKDYHKKQLMYFTFHLPASLLITLLYCTTLLHYRSQHCTTLHCGNPL